MSDALSAAIVRLEESILRARSRAQGPVKRIMLSVDDVELLIREASYVDALEAEVDRPPAFTRGDAPWQGCTFEPVMSVAHGELRHIGYQVDAEGRERAMYATDWEASGSFADHTNGSQ